MTGTRRAWLAGVLGVLAGVATAVGISATKADDAASRSECCCIVADGHLVCTITGEVLEECCCR